MGDLSKNFSKKEFACPCCHKFIKNDALLDILQALRDIIGKPVIINSGTRCPAHNAEVGGVRETPGKTHSGSAHLYGEAADIYVAGYTKGQLGGVIKKAYKDGRIPALRYCYLILSGNRAVHIGVDDRSRKSVFGW